MGEETATSILKTRRRKLFLSGWRVNGKMRREIFLEIFFSFLFFRWVIEMSRNSSGQKEVWGGHFRQEEEHFHGEGSVEDLAVLEIQG